MKFFIKGNQAELPMYPLLVVALSARGTGFGKNTTWEK